MGKSFIAFLQLFVFFAAWIASAGVVPVAIALALLWSNYYGLLVVLLYYGYRAVVPRKPWRWLHELQCNSMVEHKYFDSQSLLLEEEIKPDTKTLLGIHPHGILCCGWSLNLNMGKKLLPSKVTFLGVEILFSLPVISDMLSWYNCAPASKAFMLKFMKEGRNLALLPGGFEEATLFQRGRHRVYIKKRKGFIKYALIHGYSLCPSYTFGEELTYWTWPWLSEKLLFLNQFKIPAVFFIGRLCSFMPNDRVDLTTVVGKRLVLPQLAEPSNEDVDKWHNEYMKALQALFDKHREKYAAQGKNAKLEVL